jgi:tRNA pseudouridine38-40 synthase
LNLERLNRRTIKLVVEYDGTNYVGWQRQAEGVSIQGLIEDALAAFEGGPVTVFGAGRTDAGVHAVGQVASARLHAAHDVETLQRGLNAVLPVDVRVLSIVEAAPAFHARFDAVSKTYEYRIVNAPYVSAFLHRYAWHVPGHLDIDAMREGALALLGRHDFAAFRSAGGESSTTERTILSIDLHSWESDPRRSLTQGPDLGHRITHCPLVLRVTGDGFLRHMVRTIAGTLDDVGLGRWGSSHVAAILASRDRGHAGRAAPPCGLFLIDVSY